MNDQIGISVTADHSIFKLTVKDLAVFLVREITLRNGKGEVKQDIDRLWRGSVGSIKKGEVITDPKNLPVKVYEIEDKGGPKQYGGTLSQFAGKVQQSVTGTCITVQYFVELVPNVSGCICCGVHRMKIPIEILAPEQVFTFVVGEYQQLQGPPVKEDSSSEGD